jgi:protein-disulfide isomerase
MKHWLVPALATLALLPLSGGNALAGSAADIRALQQEIETLKQSQAKLQAEVAELKKLVQQGGRAAPSPTAFEPADLVVGNSATLGEASAPVTLFEFTDYQCPFCRRHATQVMPQLVRQYVDSGRLRIVMREFPIQGLHPRAVAASAAALCAGAQGKYMAMHDLLFENQRALDEKNLLEYADEIGLDDSTYINCLADPATANTINASLSEGQALGISGTPSFVAGLTDPENTDKVRVSRYIRGARPLADFQETIEALLGEAAEQ